MKQPGLGSQIGPEEHARFQRDVEHNARRRAQVELETPVVREESDEVRVERAAKATLQRRVNTRRKGH